MSVEVLVKQWHLCPCFQKGFCVDALSLDWHIVRRSYYCQEFCLEQQGKQVLWMVWLSFSLVFRLSSRNLGCTSVLKLYTRGQGGQVEQSLRNSKGALCKFGARWTLSWLLHHQSWFLALAL